MRQYGQQLERIQKHFNDRVDGLATQQRTLEQALHTAFSSVMPAGGGGGGGTARQGANGAPVTAANRDRLLGRLSVVHDAPVNVSA